MGGEVGCKQAVHAYGDDASFRGGKNQILIEEKGWPCGRFANIRIRSPEPSHLNVAAAKLVKAKLKTQGKVCT